MFRTILNDCWQLVIPIINEIFHENYTGNEKIEFSPNEHFLAQLAGLKAEYKEILERLNALEDQGAIGTFEKRTIIELSRDVIKEIAQKYENIQKFLRKNILFYLPKQRLSCIIRNCDIVVF